MDEHDFITQKLSRDGVRNVWLGFSGRETFLHSISCNWLHLGYPLTSLPGHITSPVSNNNQACHVTLSDSKSYGKHEIYEVTVDRTLGSSTCTWLLESGDIKGVEYWKLRWNQLKVSGVWYSPRQVQGVWWRSQGRPATMLQPVSLTIMLDGLEQQQCRL